MFIHVATEDGNIHDFRNNNKLLDVDISTEGNVEAWALCMIYWNVWDNRCVFKKLFGWKCEGNTVNHSVKTRDKGSP